MADINITCDCCKQTIAVKRTAEIPSWVIALACNFCPACEDKMNDYYEERYIPDREDGEPPITPIPVSDNQLTMPFIFDELEINQHEVHSLENDTHNL